MNDTLDAARARFRIGKAFRFEAARTREGRLEGHSFRAEVVLAADELTGPGFVADFGELAPVKRYIDAELDHRLLDEILGAGAGCGRIAGHLKDWCAAHLPRPVADRLEDLTVRTGRPQLPAMAIAFAAAHRLGGLAPGHPCGRLHGHSYVVGPLPGNGPLPAVLTRYVTAELDGRLLNDVMPAEPTSENLAAHLVEAAARLGSGIAGIRVSETETTWAEFCAETP
ncbi:6-carboxytetrahydropterin synthase [Streptomyces sp. DSM 44917]|uniref:6-carboxy-5,6,7,8-tetrahydropterin synthase n=1 Tax=Streptomyces boetiae TaxID=3075541 RepID=A0ABU2L8V3_9ACTN|nr:6-carboxytetrahydropterin synthase [Streptomyces sp. DSM 44917]MDT0307643.1 6-carboxytetrahydropterin synthase [Streptomyces sp. DSM 44917]